MDEGENMFRKTIATAACLAALAASGCASMAVTQESLEDKTSFALGLDRGDFTINNRVDEGVQTNYVVKTRNGQEYRCYVTGLVTYLGRTVSDAVCNRKGAPAANPLLEKARAR